MSITGGGRVYTVTARTATRPGKSWLRLVDHDTIEDLTGKKLGGANGAPDGGFTGDSYKKL